MELGFKQFHLVIINLFNKSVVGFLEARMIVH